MGARPLWDRDGRDWPNRAASRFVRAAGIDWHVQRSGSGPQILLVHGTGAATHSWRGLLPLLAARFEVIAPDLPGHGFTSHPAPVRMSLPGMADSLAELLAELGARPQLVVGHSAGAAILARMCLDGMIAPDKLISLNGALLPLRGVPGQVFSPVARVLASIEMVPRLFARSASDASAVERLLRGTGSHIDTAGVDLYGRLVRNPGHVSAALGMMARWDLVPLARELPGLAVPLVLAVGSNDLAVRPVEADRLKRRMPGARIEILAGLGHLAHEEAPLRVADLIFREAEPEPGT